MLDDDLTLPATCSIHKAPTTKKSGRSAKGFVKIPRTEVMSSRRLRNLESADWRAREVLKATAGEFLISAGVLTVVAAVLRFWSLNPTSVALVLLVVVLLLGGWRGMLGAVISSILATACLNYFFLPPLHTWNIDDPGNWIALGCFLVASILAGRLVTAARREAISSEARRREVDSLYRLSVDLFQTTSHVGRLDEAAQRALTAVRGTEGGLVLFGGSYYRQHVVWWSGSQRDLDEDVIAGVGRHRRTIELPALQHRDVFVPLVIDGKAAGVFVARRTDINLNTLENVAMLLALAAERERLFDEQAHVEALRESDRLKTSLLRAVSHDLASPLTALTLYARRVRRFAPVDEISVVDALDKELSRLRRRIDKLLALARLEAGTLTPSPEPTPAADLFRVVRENLSMIDRSRIVVKVDADCPDLYVDPSLALEVMVNIVENADEASPVGETIELRAGRISDTRVRLEVEDRGSGVDLVPGLDTTFEPEGASTNRRGLGIEITLGLLESIGGSLSYGRTEAGANVARIDLPAARPEAES